MADGKSLLMSLGKSSSSEGDDGESFDVERDDDEEDYSEGVADALSEVFGSDGGSKKDAFIRAVKLAMKC